AAASPQFERLAFESDRRPPQKLWPQRRSTTMAHRQAPSPAGYQSRSGRRLPNPPRTKIVGANFQVGLQHSVEADPKPSRQDWEYRFFAKVPAAWTSRSDN